MCEENQRINKFNSLLVDYLNTFNYLELNVGLCISHLDSLSMDESYKRLEKMNFDRKLEKLLELTNFIATSDLHDWCKEAHEKRNERNMYLHGQWIFFPYYDKGVEFSIAPWMRKKYSDIYPGIRFSLQEFESIVLDIKKCFERLQILRRQYNI
jgi:hypothetical protein